MNTSSEKVIKLKLLVDKKKNRVIFAESGKDFVDILFSFLTLPMGTIIRLVRNQLQPSVIGSMNNLYEGLENLEFGHYMWGTYKAMLLRPVNSSDYLCRQLKLNIDDTKPPVFYTCDCCCNDGKAVLGTNSFALCQKGKILTKAMHLIKVYSEHLGQTDLFGAKEGIFVKGEAMFLISEDLKVLPLSTSACIELLSKLGIEEINMLEETTVMVGLEEVLSLLGLLFVSTTPLTDLFMPKESKVASTLEAKFQASHEYLQNDPVSNGKMMTLKVILRKSDRKLLYAEAGADFVDYLLSQLAIPLGTILQLLYESPYLRCASNMYKSVEELGVGLYLNSEHLKKKLLSPKLSPHFGYQIHPLGIKEMFFPQDLCSFQYLNSETSSTIHINEASKNISSEQGCFVQQETTFMVTNDLIVTPLSSISAISLFKKLNVPISDIEEQVVNFGREEALKLLEASLISKSALTSAFNINIKMKIPKLEK